MSIHTEGVKNIVDGLTYDQVSQTILIIKLAGGTCFMKYISFE